MGGRGRSGRGRCQGCRWLVLTFRPTSRGNSSSRTACSTADLRTEWAYVTVTGDSVLSQHWPMTQQQPAPRPVPGCSIDRWCGASAYVGVAVMAMQGSHGFTRIRTPYVFDAGAARIAEATSHLTEPASTDRGPRPAPQGYSRGRGGAWVCGRAPDHEASLECESMKAPTGFIRSVQIEAGRQRAQGATPAGG